MNAKLSTAPQPNLEAKIVDILKYLTLHAFRCGNWQKPIDPLEDEVFIKATHAIQALLIEARVEENESFKSVFDDTQTWAEHCYNHKEYMAQCHACRQYKWFKELSQKVIPIIE